HHLSPPIATAPHHSSQGIGAGLLGGETLGIGRGPLCPAVRFGALDIGIDPREESLAMLLDVFFKAADVDQFVPDTEDHARASSISLRMARIEASRPMNIASPIKK